MTATVTVFRQSYMT